MHAQVYESLTQSPDRFWGLMAQNTHVYLRTAPSVAPASIFPAVRNRLAQKNRDLVAFEPEPMDFIVADSIARQRFTMTLFTGFAVVALLPALAFMAYCLTLWDSEHRRSASAWHWERNVEMCYAPSCAMARA